MAGNGSVDVVVVGAGLAGLACALDVAAAGRRVRVLEAADAVGGRMRTDPHQGFRLDRGFQVFNTRYPQVRRRLDLRPLRLQPFTPGFVLAGSRGRYRFGDPLRRPGTAVDLLTGRVAPPRDAAALALLGLRDGLLPAATLRRSRDVTTRAALREAGISGPTVDGLLRPFLAGVFLEDELVTSARVFHLYWRSMLRGTLALPAAGIGAVPAALAAELPAGTLELGAPVSGLTPNGVELADGRHLPARHVVVATDPMTAGTLLPGLPVPAMRSVTTFYHAAERSPLAEPTLLVDSDRTVLNSVVLSEVAPDCAPPGLSLVSTSVLGTTADEAGVRRRLAELYGCDTSAWQPLAAYRIAGALPAMPAPHPLTRTSRWAPGRYVCGDHRTTGSVQGALASGARAARELLTDLAARPAR
ncbi:NAD(P)/FAD-dependent oxidoreductase [Streptomyces sp. TLI_171]|uniref:NAD(P)/FAD-dependent oxidoreductase n=1 Tax=Streptomyces sp. TLI_171 TaxID=1938859 RepID=UPI000C18768F|nr:NAD(P)/FAD-dependent oxidoreductase [Streptomyces sp. TLI_171]RKE23432.1 flavin-dependent amine oxidoreductase [Streptomyces sp. TLI_171]